VTTARRATRSLALPIAVGKAVRAAARLRGGGSAFPGHVARRIRPTFVRDVVAQLPLGVVVVLGSNGKSTTTNMLTSIVRAHGLRVFTNPSGANLPQGIASSLLGQVGITGALDADIGVIEVDEAYGQVLCRELAPSAAVILNLQIDQIYRFFEPERVAGMFRDIVAEVSGTVVLNRDDAFLSTLGARLEREGRLDVRWFGVAPEVIDAAPHGQVLARDYENEGADEPADRRVEVEVLASDGVRAELAHAGATHDAVLPARGLHYAVDAAGAISLAEAALGDRFSIDTAIEALRSTATVYGRGEVIEHDGQQLEILLLKNLASLQMNLDALEGVPESVLLAFDEGSKDPSWLYAADFSALRHVDVVSGPKAWFIALRLEYAGVTYGTVEPSIERALRIVLDSPRPTDGRRTLILDYDQMLLARKHLGRSDLEAEAR